MPMLLIKAWLDLPKRMLITRASKFGQNTNDAHGCRDDKDPFNPIFHDGRATRRRGARDQIRQVVGMRGFDG